MSKRITDEKLNVEMSINGVNKTQAEISKIQTSIRGLKTENEDLAAAKRKLLAEGKRESDQYKELTKRQQENRVSIDKYTADQKKLQKQLGLTGMTMKQLRKEQTSLKAQMSNFVPNTPEWNKLNRELKETDKRLDSVRKEMRSTGGVMGKMQQTFGGFGSLFIGGAGIMAAWQGIKKLVGVNYELSDSQANVQKTTGLSSKEIDVLTKKLKKLDTRTTVDELHALAEEAGRLGKDSVKDVLGFVKTADMIKVALGDDLQGDINENVQLIGKLATQYGVGEKYGVDFGKSMEKIGSSINEVAASGANQAGFLVDYLKRLVGISAQADISAQNQIGFAAALDEAGQSVEVSGTTMSKVITDMYKNTAEYANIANMSTEEFAQLLKEDANEALLQFLEGLNGNGEGLQQMTAKMEDLKLEGSRSISVLTTLAANTDLVRARQETANKAMSEGTSLAAEFSVKNDNLAGNLDKVGKAFSEAFTSGTIADGLNALVKGFGQLIGVIKDADTAFDQEVKRTYESAQANRQLARESSKLLTEYQSLTKEGVTPTKEEKEKLEIITLQLRDRLGESVVAIDKETGAFKLNIEAVKEQIKLKRLAADEEAATLASRLKGSQDKIDELEEERKSVQRNYELRKKYFEDQNRDDLEALKNSSSLSAMEKQQMKERMAGYKEMDQALSSLKNINTDIATQKENEIDLTKKLNELNFDQADVDRVYNEDPAADDNTPNPNPTPDEFISEEERKRRAAEAERKRESYSREEDQLTDLITKKRADREIASMEGMQRELAQIDEKYRVEIEKAEGHADRIAELEALKDQEKEDAKARRKKEYLDRAAEIEEENRQLKEEAEMEREVAAATTQQEKDELRLEHARQIALRELEMMKEAELAKVEAVEGSEELIFAIKEKYRLQADKLNREFDKGEENLRKDQVKWTEMTEQQKLNAITGALGNAAEAFNEGSDAWKAIKISETVISTYQSAQSAFNSLAEIPFVGPALGAAAAGAAIVAGMKKVDAIRNTELKKMPTPAKKNVRGHEDGLYSDVTRTDGKRFRARNMGRTRTQIVTQPSYFQDDYLAGEAGAELIVDNATFRKLDPSVVQHIMDVRHNVRGFETGKYPASLPQPAQVPQTDPEMKMMLSMLISRLNEPIKAETKWGYDEVEKSKQLESEINRSNQNGNLTS